METLSPDELVGFVEKRMVAQVILAARYAEKQMPQGLTGNAFRESQEALSLEWMEDTKGRSFFRGVRKMTDLATGVGEASSKERAEAVRFTRGLLELGSARKPHMGESGVILQLTPQEVQLADELQAALDRIEPRSPADTLI